MSAPLIHILTTDGPVAIQRISEEDPAVSSVICLDGRAQALPISPAYDAFVRSPVGVIERMTGHGAYRMDVARRIDDGRSWQLAAFIAHAAALQSAPTIRHIYASGEVDSTLGVRPVGHIDTKLKALSDALSGQEGDAPDAIILVPSQDTPLPEYINGIAVRAVQTTDEALVLIGLAAPDRHIPADKPARDAYLKKITWRMPLILTVIAAIVFWFGSDLARWSALMAQGRILALEKDMAAADETAIGQMRVAVYQKWRSFSKPEAGTIDIVGSLFIADDAAGCAAAGSLQKRPLGTGFTGTEAICKVEVRAVTADTRLQIIGRLGYWPTGLGVGGKAGRVMRGSKEATGRTWTLEFENLPAQGAALRLVVIAGTNDVRGSQPWYQDLLATPEDSTAFKAAAARLEHLGYRVIARDWRRD
ncbi:MAG: hypothetical protein WD075_11385 [Rhodospirillales bacterium]